MADVFRNRTRSDELGPSTNRTSRIGEMKFWVPDDLSRRGTRMNKLVKTNRQVGGGMWAGRCREAASTKAAEPF